MLNAVIRLALRYRLMVVIVCLIVLVYGSYLASRLPIDVLPDLDRTRVIVLAECPGLAAEEVEALVTLPIETAMLGAPGVMDVRSQSAGSLCVVYAEFDWGTEVRAARQTVQERLTNLTGVLPEGVRAQMTPPTSLMGQIVLAGLYRQAGPGGGALAAVGKSGLLAELGDGRVRVWRPVDRDDPHTWEEVPAKARVDGRKATLTVAGRQHEVDFGDEASRAMELRTLADWVVRPRLLKVPGVAEVFAQGADRKQYQVLIDPVALREHGLTLGQVEQALKDNNLNASGGFAVQGESERPIRVLGRLGPDSHRVLQDLRKVVVKAGPPRAVLLGQVARVAEGQQFKRGDGSIDGRPGVVFTIAKQPHADTRAVTAQVTAALRDIEAALPADVVIRPDLFQLARFIDRGVWNVGEALVIGAVMVLIVLFLFLLNFRTTFITLTAIPLSLVLTALTFRVMSWLTGTNLSINVMTLGGIAVAMGELVDDAIVDVENIFRRLKENYSSPNPRHPLAVVYDASLEVRGAIVFGTAVVILVFLPLFTLSGVEGRLFSPLAVAYIVSILASLLVSLTVTPVLSYYLLPQSSAAHHAGDGPLLRLLKRLAVPLVRLSMARPVLLLVLTWAMVGVAAWQLSRLGRSLLPPFDEGSVQVTVTLPPGSSLEASNRVSASIDAVFRGMMKTAKSPKGEVLHFVRRTGRAEMDEHAQAVSESEYILSINPDSGKEREEIIRTILEEVGEAAPGVEVEVEQPLAHLISHMISGVSAQIAIKVFGDDLGQLRQTAERIKAAIRTVPGLTPPVIEAVKETDELHIRLRPDDLAFHGVSRAHVAEFLGTALQGEVVSQVLEGQRRFDLLLRLDAPYRTDYAQLGRMQIDLPGGRGPIELRELADVETGTGPNAVRRENARRRIVVRCNTQGRDLSSVVTDIRARVASQVELPPGYFVEYGGQFESQEEATRLIGLLAAVSAAGMFVVLLMLFPSVRVALQILNALPTAFIGGVIALVLTKQPLTVAALVGFISLGGIAVRNGILLVTHYFHLMRHEGEGFTPEMVLRGSLERLAPVLMTALTAGIGLVPLVWAGNEPGREVLYPVATVILGGLITSTFCEFLIHPGLFWRFSGHDAERLAKAEAAEERMLGEPLAHVPGSPEYAPTSAPSPPSPPGHEAPGAAP